LIRGARDRVRRAGVPSGRSPGHVPDNRGSERVSDDQALFIVGLIMVIGILLGVAWVFFNPVVDLALGLTVAVGGFIWWRLRRAG